MNKEKVIEHIKKSEWVNQAGEGKILYVSVPSYVAVHGLTKLHEGTYGVIFSSCFDGNGTWGLELHSIKALAHSLVDKNHAEKDYIARIDGEMDAAVAKFESFIAALPDLKTLSDDELTNLIKDYFKIQSAIWNPYLPVDTFDPLWKGILNDLFAKYSITMSEEEIVALVQPDHLSFVQQEELSLLALAKDFSEEKLDEHHANYFWYQNNYAKVTALPIDHFRDRLAQVTDPDHEITQITEKIQRAKKRKTEILAKHNLVDEVLDYFELLGALTYWRDTRKKYNLLTNYYSHEFASEVARRRNIPVELFEDITVIEFVNECFTLSKEELERRKGKCVLYYIDGEDPFVAYAQDALDIKKEYDQMLHEEVETLQGMCASPGKIIGRVKVILKVSEFSKMERGDILVSTMTRPEFVPVMKKAAAIVTDEGGITSHAAIVSRELGIPCVIGTKHATRILKDGQKVEVDAEKGIVTVIE